MGFTRYEAFTAALVGNVFLVLGCLAAGRLSDRLGGACSLQGHCYSWSPPTR